MVQVGADAQVTVVEVQTSAPGVDLVAAVTEIAVGDAARVRYLTVQDLDPGTWQVATQVSQVGASADFLAAGAALGGDYARLRTDCRLVGRGAIGNLLAAYFGDGDQMLDFRTFQDHAAPDTTSDLLFKGAVADHARSVYTGLIRVRPRRPGHRTPSRPTATSSCPRTPGPSRCPTSRSRTTTCSAATPPPSVRSTTSSASTSRAVACPPTWPSG